MTPDTEIAVTFPAWLLWLVLWAATVYGAYVAGRWTQRRRTEGLTPEEIGDRVKEEARALARKRYRDAREALDAAAAEVRRVTGNEPPPPAERPNKPPPDVVLALVAAFALALGFSTDTFATGNGPQAEATAVSGAFAGAVAGASAGAVSSASGAPVSVSGGTMKSTAVGIGAPGLSAGANPCAQSVSVGPIGWTYEGSACKGIRFAQMYATGLHMVPAIKAALCADPDHREWFAAGGDACVTPLSTQP